MWTRPREVVRFLAFNRPTYGVYYLATAYALEGLFFYANWWSLGVHSHASSYFGFAALLSPFIGFGWLYLGGAFFYLLGKAFKGIGSMIQLRSALAWSSIPYLITLFVWLFLFSFSSEHVFIQDSGPYSSVFIIFITLVVKIWSLVLLVQSIREVQHFSLGVSILNIIIVWIFSWIIFFFSFSFFRFLFF